MQATEVMAASDDNGLKKTEQHGRLRSHPTSTMTQLILKSALSSRVKCLFDVFQHFRQISLGPPMQTPSFPTYKRWRCSCHVFCVYIHVSHVRTLPRMVIRIHPHKDISMNPQPTIKNHIFLNLYLFILPMIKNKSCTFFFFKIKLKKWNYQSSSIV